MTNAERTWTRDLAVVLLDAAREWNAGQLTDAEMLASARDAATAKPSGAVLLAMSEEEAQAEAEEKQTAREELAGGWWFTCRGCRERTRWHNPHPPLRCLDCDPLAVGGAP